MARRVDFGDVNDDPMAPGEDLTFRIQMVKRNSSGVDVVEGDVSGNAYTLTLKKSPSDADALIQVSTGGGEITFDDGDVTENELAGSDTVLVIALVDDNTELITEEGLYHFDVWRTDAGNESMVALGTMYFKEPVRF